METQRNPELNYVAKVLEKFEEKLITSMRTLISGIREGVVKELLAVSMDLDTGETRPLISPEEAEEVTIKEAMSVIDDGKDVLTNSELVSKKRKCVNEENLSCKRTKCDMYTLYTPCSIVASISYKPPLLGRMLQFSSCSSSDSDNSDMEDGNQNEPDKMLSPTSIPSIDDSSVRSSNLSPLEFPSPLSTISEPLWNNLNTSPISAGSLSSDLGSDITTIMDNFLSDHGLSTGSYYSYDEETFHNIDPDLAPLKTYANNYRNELATIFEESESEDD